MTELNNGAVASVVVVTVGPAVVAGAAMATCRDHHCFIALWIAEA